MSHPTDRAADLVVLDRDHPGFRDPTYRARRNAIARLALEYRDGDAVPDAPYTDAEHGVWREVWAHVAPLHEKRACRCYRDASAALDLPRDRIPQLAEVNAWLGKNSSSFRMLPVAGLVTPRRFMLELAGDGFLSTQYVRHHSTPLYTPEPDVIHELVGHAPTLVDPGFAAVNRAFGTATQRADEATIEALIRLYWFTVEFGLALEDGVPKAYGAGLLSSFGELGSFEERAELVPFEVERIVETSFDTSDYQTVLFVADSVDQAFSQMLAYLDRVGATASA